MKEPDKEIVIDGEKYIHLTSLCDDGELIENYEYYLNSNGHKALFQEEPDSEYHLIHIYQSENYYPELIDNLGNVITLEIEKPLFTLNDYVETGEEWREGAVSLNNYRDENKEFSEYEDVPIYINGVVKGFEGKVITKSVMIYEDDEEGLPKLKDFIFIPCRITYMVTVEGNVKRTINQKFLKKIREAINE
jgi:hypothetical protein